MSTPFSYFLKYMFFIFFLQNCWHYARLLVSFFLVGNKLIRRMRKCRNWQTSKTKDLVTIAVVWVQVPSSALLIRVRKPYKLRLPRFLFLNCLNTLEHVHIRHFATDCRFVGRYSIFQRFRCKNVTLVFVYHTTSYPSRFTAPDSSCIYFFTSWRWICTTFSEKFSFFNATSFPTRNPNVKFKPIARYATFFFFYIVSWPTQ